MTFFPVTSNHFDKQFSKLTRKDAVFREQAVKKIEGIINNEACDILDSLVDHWQINKSIIVVD